MNLSPGDSNLQPCLGGEGEEDEEQEDSGSSRIPRYHCHVGSLRIPHDLQRRVVQSQEKFWATRGRDGGHRLWKPHPACQRWLMLVLETLSRRKVELQAISHSKPWSGYHHSLKWCVEHKWAEDRFPSFLTLPQKEQVSSLLSPSVHQHIHTLQNT